MRLSKASVQVGLDRVRNHVFIACFVGSKVVIALPSPVSFIPKRTYAKCLLICMNVLISVFC